MLFLLSAVASLVLPPPVSGYAGLAALNHAVPQESLISADVVPWADAKRLLRREVAVDGAGLLEIPHMTVNDRRSMRLPWQQEEEEQLAHADPVRRHQVHRHMMRSAGGHEADGSIGFYSAADMPAKEVVNKSWKKEPECDMKTTMCCDPSNAEWYMQCMQENCRVIKSPPALCEEIGMCTLKCAANCCCFFRTAFRSARAASQGLVETMLRTLVLIQALLQGAAEREEGVPLPKVKNKPDPNEVRNYAIDVMKEVVMWAFAIPMVSLFFASFSESLFKLIRRRKPKEEEGVRTEEPNAKQDAEKQELETYLSAEEQDRLGGIVNYTITKVEGITAFQWTLANSLGLAYFSILMTIPVTINVVALGRSGRLMVLSRTPLMSAVTAAKMFAGIGISIISFTISFHCFIRSTERSVLEAQDSPDPAVRAKLEGSPLKGIVVGKCHFFTLAFIVGFWLCMLFLLKRRIRPWGFQDEKNFYEATEACVGQYFRAGIRGAIPCLSKRRRVGGMRIFFGPYPSKQIFSHLGSQFEVLKNVEPLLKLPTETSNAYPASGNGAPVSSEDQAGTLSWILGLMNLFLGALGLSIFIVHIYNLATNVQNCPLGSSVQPCLQAAECTSLGKSPWFTHYLFSKELRTADQLAKDQLASAIDINMIGVWLGASSLGAVKTTVLDIARHSCRERYVELFVDPTNTLTSGSSDTIGKFNAKNYLESYKSRGYNVSWDDKSMHCKDCVNAMGLMYFTYFDNVVEIIEVFMLAVTAYVSLLVYRMTSGELENCPMIDVGFQSFPGSKQDVDVHKVERAMMDMIGHTFGFRYEFMGVPEHISTLEKGVREEENKYGENWGDITSKLPDPWSYNVGAKTWEDYDITSKTKARMMYVNKELLGILQDEEVVAAWSEAPRLTWPQVITIFGGTLFLSIMPLCFAIGHRQPMCFAEAAVSTLVHYFLCDYFILRRRAQAGFVLTSRRIFQITRRPAYYDIFGKNEPLLKLDIVIHNCGITYATMTMEAYVPFWRRLLKLQLFRQGQLLVQGTNGIFRLWRRMGDTREIFNHFSKVTYMMKHPTLTRHMGQGFMEEEKKHKEDKAPDPLCSCICCPHTPLPPATQGQSGLERYCTKFKSEHEVYSRKLSIRPASCGELCCGRGCNIECSCCCCCRLDELVTELTVTTHRVLVEQRVVQRYCRLTACFRKTPNLRVTYLAHHKASAYLAEKDAKAWGMSKLRQDMCVKLLHTGGHEYSHGLMLHQKPYQFLQKKDLPANDRLWVTNLCSIYDVVTQREQYADEDDKSAASNDTTSESEGGFSDEEKYGGMRMSLAPGNNGKGKGKGKGAVKGKKKGKPTGSESGKSPGEGGKGKKAAKGKEGQGAGESGKEKATAKGKQSQGSGESKGKVVAKGKEGPISRTTAGKEKGKTKGKPKMKGKGGPQEQASAAADPGAWEDLADTMEAEAPSDDHASAADAGDQAIAVSLVTQAEGTVAWFRSAFSGTLG